MKFALKYIQDYGVESLIADPSDLIEWKQRRAEDYLTKIDFSEIEADIIAALYEYRFIAADTLISAINKETSDVARSLRRLEEYCCIERRGAYYYISAPIREAIRRDKRFTRAPKWFASLNTIICQIADEYKNDEAVRIPVLESAVIAAAALGDRAPSYLSALILPSHLLRIARDCYDRKRWRDCLDFCKRAFLLQRRMTTEGQIELLRLWGLSAIRLSEQNELHFVNLELAKHASRVAERVSHFLKGFDARVRGYLDEAEKRFTLAWRISPNNQHVNRELASLYCKQRRYTEAEAHARSAYKLAPTNPFLIDILLETIIGKQSQGLEVDHEERTELFRELRKYGDAPGSAHYQIRTAQHLVKQKDYPEALKCLAQAIARTDNLLTPYFLRADVYLAMGSVGEAEKDLKRINQLLQEAGGYSEGEEAQLHELEVRVLIEKKQYQAAKDKITLSAFLPANVAKRLSKQLARTIGFEPAAATPLLRTWAKNYKD